MQEAVGTPVSKHVCSQSLRRAATTMRVRSPAWHPQTPKAAATACTYLQRPAQLGERLQAQQVEEDLRKGAFQVGQRRDLGRPATQPQLMDHEPGIQALRGRARLPLWWASTEDMDCGQTWPGVGKTCRRCRWACNMPMKTFLASPLCPQPLCTSRSQCRRWSSVSRSGREAWLPPRRRCRRCVRALSPGPAAGSQSAPGRTAAASRPALLKG